MWLHLKGIVLPEMKITPWFTHPQAILVVYDFLLSDKYNLSYINKLYNDSEWGREFEVQ